jgi:putative peptide zinc metalloprotease protein
MWHVVQHPSNNQFFRLNEPAYHFVGLLDGQRTVAQAWKIASEQLGDNAPTQGEAIHLMGQLYTSNLLLADLPGDTEALFRRYRKRIRREIQGYLMNLLFIRIPLFDPDHVLDSWLPIFGKLFTWFGLLLLAVLLGTGFYSLAGRWGDLFAKGKDVLDPSNLFYLYIGTVLVKVIHEFGHSFACKKFGRDSGSGGEVHVMGVMFLIFTPMPYMDASSAWALRSKWHRVVIGAAGMMVELGIAAIAAIAWAHTSDGTVHTILFNMMFVASVSTVLFNANPLLRYDGYYILSDLLEIPNLSQRATDYLKYLVRRYIWRVRNLQCPAHSGGERAWFIVYGIASTIYRAVIYVGIILFVYRQLPFVGMFMAVAGGAAFMIVPTVKFIHYLGTSGELMRVRAWAVTSSVVFFGGILAALGLVSYPDRFVGEGVAEPTTMAIVYALEDGFVVPDAPGQPAVVISGARVTKGQTTILRSANPELETQYRGLLAQKQEMEIKRDMSNAAAVERADDKDHDPAAQQDAIASAKIYQGQVDAIDAQIQHVEQQIDWLTLKSPLDGEFTSPDIDQLPNSYVKRGQRVGVVADLDNPIIRFTVPQKMAAVLVKEHKPHLKMRLEGRPQDEFGGEIIEPIIPAGQEQLPSAALGFPAGGQMAVSQEDKHGTKAAEEFFEIQVKPDGGHPRLLPGQRILGRFEAQPKPLMYQWYRTIQQLMSNRQQQQTKAAARGQ